MNTTNTAAKPKTDEQTKAGEITACFDCFGRGTINWYDRWGCLYDVTRCKRCSKSEAA